MLVSSHFYSLVSSHAFPCPFSCRASKFYSESSTRPVRQLPLLSLSVILFHTCFIFWDMQVRRNSGAGFTLHGIQPSYKWVLLGGISNLETVLISAWDTILKYIPLIFFTQDQTCRGAILKYLEVIPKRQKKRKAQTIPNVPMHVWVYSKFFRFSRKTAFYQCRVMVFGLCIAPSIFTIIIRPVIHLFRSLTVKNCLAILSL